MNLFLTANAGGILGNQTTVIIAYVVFLIAIMYFMLIRPQKKEEAKKKALMDSLAVGDSILTTSGFYGIIKDMTDDTVIVEFGNNKNCRITMKKSAIFKKRKDYHNFITIFRKHLLSEEHLLKSHIKMIFLEKNSNFNGKENSNALECFNEL